jgi:glycine cleavage system H protein
LLLNRFNGFLPAAVSVHSALFFSERTPMSEVDATCRYLKSHEWARKEADGSITIGISDHAQAALGELVFVELPAVGKDLSAGNAAAVVESVKAASDVYAPVSGTVSAINDALNDKPETINDSCYTNGWMFRIQPSNAGDYDALLDAAAYQATISD